MKAKINYLLMLLLGFFGISCDNLRIMGEYGCPNADYSIKGRVVDEEGTPIKGIKVTAIESWEYYEAKTDEDGNYSINYNTIPEFGEDMEHKVAFDDIDGEENGGKFRSDTLVLEYEQVKPGSSVWYKGAYEAEADVVLTKENPEETSEEVSTPKVTDEER